jgi:peptidoglycan/xylan/chitin deacetylase (PgdA/CDA1 family)
MHHAFTARPALLLAALLALSTIPASALRPPSEIAAPGGSPFWPAPAGEAPVPGAGLGDRAMILCWHTFLGNPRVPTDFSVAEVGRQLDSLLALGYRFVSLEELLLSKVEGGLNLVATIDDGHRTITQAYGEAFAARGIVPALFIYPAVIGNVPQFLSAERLRELRDAGSVVGAHGYYHLFVTADLYRSDRASFDREIYQAKARVESLTGLPAYIYAYPYGAFSDVTKAEVARAGYAYGLAVKQGFVFAEGRHDDPYELPRSVVTREAWASIYDLLERNARAAKESSSRSPKGPRTSVDFWGGAP